MNRSEYSVIYYKRIVIVLCVVGLNEQFSTKSTCQSVLDYMVKHRGQKKLMFRNYLVLFHHVFDGLSYLQTQEIVHRDIKCKLRTTDCMNIYMQNFTISSIKYFSTSVLYL